MEPITSRAKLIESLKNVLSVETLARDSYDKDVHIFKNKRLKVVIEKIKKTKSATSRFSETLLKC